MKLELNLIPSSTFKNNVRAIVSKAQWDIIKTQVSSAAYNVCEICGGVGPKHPVECHEIFSYDLKNKIQKLEGMIALCPNCHMCKHFGLARIRGNEERAIKHLMRVNNLSRDKIIVHINESFYEWQTRSLINWTLDFSYLQKYGINLK